MSINGVLEMKIRCSAPGLYLSEVRIVFFFFIIIIIVPLNLTINSTDKEKREKHQMETHDRSVLFHDKGKVV